MKTIIKLPE